MGGHGVRVGQYPAYSVGKLVSQAHAIWRTVRNHGRTSSKAALPSVRSNFRPFKGLEFSHGNQPGSFSTE
jgi:hypothetical protein